MPSKIKLKKNPHSKEIAKKFEKLVDVVFTLRSEGGCPWDRAQSLPDLKQYLLEECYELLEALDQQKESAIREELGDVFFQVLFLSQMMQEQGTFTLLNVVNHLLEKMIGRHPHVFGDTKAGTPDEAIANWESRKGKEITEREGRHSLLQGVPADLPALLQANVISTKVARVGFDWESEEEVWKKFEEELTEFRDAATPAEKEEELGDILFTLVNIARKNKINPEDALRAANAKFRRRFNALEEKVKAQKKQLTEMNAKELDLIWDDVKKKS
jgi:tetrapyrrole methylase family protein/MazG family protein